MKVWWCEEHGYQATERAANHPNEILRLCWGTSYGESDGPWDSEEDYTPCTMVEMLLVSVDALVIEKEDGGLWPESARAALRDILWNTRGYTFNSILDALAQSQVGERGT